MKYSKFEIQNFKGINKVSIDLEKNRVITLVGLNESGKTTIMEAIEVFYHMITGDDLEEEDLNYFRPKGTDFTGEIAIEGSLNFEQHDINKIQKFWKTDLGKRSELEIGETFTYSFRFIFELHKYVKTKNSVTIDLKTKTSNKRLHSTDNDSWQKVVNFIKTKLIPEILYYEDFIFTIPETIQFILPSAPEGTESDKTKKWTNLKWQRVLDDILKATNPKFISFQKHVVDLWESDKDTAEQRISQVEEILNLKITEAWKDLFKSSGKKLNFKEIKLTCEPSGSFLNISFKVKTDKGKIFKIDERSKGCKWFFSFLLFTEFRKNRTDNILFLLDEPASNLHSSAQRKILNAIKELSDQSLVIYSTHSHHLINIEWLIGAYVVINDTLGSDSLSGDMTFLDGAEITAEKYYTYVGSGKGDDKISYFQPILDALDYQPSPVEPIPNICILEGKTDWYAFKYFQEVILKDKNTYNFYPGAGATKLWDIIRLYLSWGKEFLVIIDGDPEGEKAKKAYVEEFGDFIKDRIFTLNDILKIKGSTEKIITDDDKKALCIEAFGKPSTTKKILNQAINKLLINKQSVKISKETKDNFKKIFKFIIDNK